MAYLDLFVGPIATGNKDAYNAYAEKMAALTMQAGALSVVACWGADLPEGMPCLLAASVDVGADETVVLRMVSWNSRQDRDAGWAAMMNNPAMQAAAVDMPFDRSRVRYCGFEVLSDR